MDSTQPGVGGAPPAERPHFAIEHYARPPDSELPPPPPPAPKPGVLRRIGQRLVHLLDDREPSSYSSSAPRHPDGHRTQVMPFNGNGRGR